jgi:hypothetical protein
MLAGIFSLSPGISSLMNSVIIESAGRISIPDVTAKSGYWRDIQAAVDWVVTHGGVGNVHIPEGTFDFVKPEDGIKDTPRVTVPAGISVFGAPTDRDAKGQVIEWKTVLQVPYEGSSFPTKVNGDYTGTSFQFFQFVGNGDPNKPSRASDIKFVGYREFNHSSPYWYSAIEMYNVVDFRIDHCFFKNVPADCVTISAPANGAYRGVIDHCKLINDYGYVEWYIFDCSVGYGISINPYGTTFWEDDITKVLGKYNNNTVFIEDCYFSRWRHCVCSNAGVHYVFRHNTIEKDSPTGSIDAHGTYDYVGTRAIEIYDNIIIDPVVNWEPENWNSTEPAEWAYGVNWRGGGGVFFNNYIRNYKTGIIMVREGSVEKCWPHDVWIWNNTWVNVQTQIDPNDCQQNVDYFLYAPSWYTPYPYPHPLTLSTT